MVDRTSVETYKLVDYLVHEFLREGSHPFSLRSGDVGTDVRCLYIWKGASIEQIMVSRTTCSERGTCLISEKRRKDENISVVVKLN